MALKGRLLIVANRLPFTRVDGGLVPSTGGLATGLRGVHARHGGQWFGWLGDRARSGAEARDVGDGVVEIPLTALEIARYYEGFSNGVLWPLFHYLVDQLPLDARHFDTWVRVNERFADAVATRWRPGDRVWVHDYQLCLVPAMLRRRLGERARVGFFLHIPFPAAEVVRTLPWRREILEGMLGADLVGFHTATYASHFLDSCRLLLAARVSDDQVRHGGRASRVGAWPMGVDARRIAAAADAVADAAARLRPADEQVILGIDRLDYTKGIPRRLLAFERLLARHPALHGRVRLVQVAVPSRERVPAYRDLRRLVEQLVGRINGAFGTATWTPVHYVFRALPHEEVLAHYRAADVLLVTPLRDGMNLVAKEFVAARTDEDGVLVLSELAGAAEELDAALQVNPYDVDGTAATIYRALTMAPRERRVRMRALRSRVGAADIHAWADGFVAALDAPAAPSPTAPQEIAAATGRARALLLLDYDGTLVAFRARPEDAVPDDALIDLLTRLAARHEVALVSGRRKEDLDDWFGALPLALFAEHGLWHRMGPGVPWVRREVGDLGWLELVAGAMDAAATRCPGTRVERKTAGVTFHWRGVSGIDHEIRELRHALHELARWLPFEPVDGACVIEVRPRGVHKGGAIDVLRAAGRLLPSTPVVAIGDDHTDEDLFAALPPGAVSVLVGNRPSLAHWRVGSPDEVRAVLAALLDDPLSARRAG